MSGDDRKTVLRSGTFFGPYRIVRLLGKGGMGEVYLAEDPATLFPYALKILDPSAAGADAAFMSRFVQEAEFATKVRHPNLVAVLEAGIDGGTGLCYMLMEYMPGGSLRELIRADGAVSFPSVTTIATDIARALVLVEENGMVHRDVKPENVLFASDGTAKLTDLGISRFSSPEGGVSVTRTGGTIGTPAYMAPEQMLDSHDVDIRADIYSLGVVMYEMIAGRRPNEGEGAMNTLAKAIDGRAFPNVRTVRPDTPVPLAVLVSEMTLPDRIERPVSARMVLELLSHPDRVVGAFESLRAPASVLAAPPPPARPWHRDRAVLYAMTAMVLALEALAVALATVFTRS